MREIGSFVPDYPQACVEPFPYRHLTPAALAEASTARFRRTGFLAMSAVCSNKLLYLPQLLHLGIVTATIFRGQIVNGDF